MGRTTPLLLESPDRLDGNLIVPSTALPLVKRFKSRERQVQTREPPPARWLAALFGFKPDASTFDSQPTPSGRRDRRALSRDIEHVENPARVTNSGRCLRRKRQQSAPTDAERQADVVSTGTAPANDGRPNEHRGLCPSLPVAKTAAGKTTSCQPSIALSLKKQNPN